MHRIDLSIKMQDLSSFIVVTTISSTQANVDNEVQSLSTAKGQILIGMRNGDILEFQSHEEIQDGILTVLGQFQDN